MLKFIVPSSFMYLTVLSNFKTSYVEVYPFWVALIPAILLYFKTSYVEVYRYLYFLYFWTGHISKHLMLKFIFLVQIYQKDIWNFKTSYVEVYPIFENALAILDSFQNILC